MAYNQPILTRLTGVVIVDFDNVFKTPVSHDKTQMIELELKEFLGELLSENNALEEVNIRLYGGWYHGDKLTNKASVLQQVISNVNIFPYIDNLKKRKIQGTVELVYSLFFVPSLIWKNTYKEKDGIKSIRINQNSLTNTCSSNSSICPPKIIAKFTRKKRKVCSVTNCNTIQENVFKGMEQKMVDTMMACDIMSYADEEQVKSIVVVSDDTDILPSLVVSKQKNNTNCSFTLIIKNNRIKDNCNYYLSPFDIPVKILS
ncbi:PIN domain-containing protein [Aureispira anguillae]|uniref:NYN domain-containing protein n=1 Tax=Aureispira anguillae TaxID=2864201 RepID=A0A916DSL7_9BACT|nr:NYN domain-containing protein [Aureispira anguillae]BDS10886.1 NYN domain-containing protein [Aureispira anguillae]